MHVKNGKRACYETSLVVAVESLLTATSYYPSVCCSFIS